MIPSLNISIVFKSLKIEFNDQDHKTPLHFGGPVESEKGLILHSCDYQQDVLLKINDQLMLSSNAAIIKNMAQGMGPKKSLLLLGYAGWGSGHLESEIRNGNWIVNDFSEELLFSSDNYLKYKMALKSAGVSSASMICGAGRA